MIMTFLADATHFLRHFALRHATARSWVDDTPYARGAARFRAGALAAGCGIGACRRRAAAFRKKIYDARSLRRRWHFAAADVFADAADFRGLLAVRAISGFQGVACSYYR